jgi:hypothetical protein
MGQIYHPCVCGHITLQHRAMAERCTMCPCQSYRRQGRANKYGAKAQMVDGVRFASKREAAHYQGLQMARKSGELLFFLRQVPFHLPGGVRYVVDFVEFWKGGEIRFVDVKGHKTREYITKKKIVEATYPVVIMEV